MTAVAAALGGCGGGGTKTVTAPTHTVTVSSTTSTVTSSSHASQAAQPPSTEQAQQYAQRTYVVQPSLGKRVFKVASPRLSTTASDGSLISAYDIVLADSGDGTGQAVLLFRGQRFLGWASDRLALRLSSSTSGDAIAVNYGDFQGNDPLCCPSAHKIVRYSWGGSRVVADGDPPRSYGRQGDQLHLAGG
jgi:hypothetical protein